LEAFLNRKPRQRVFPSQTKLLKGKNVPDDKEKMGKPDRRTVSATEASSATSLANIAFQSVKPEGWLSVTAKTAKHWRRQLARRSIVRPASGLLDTRTFVFQLP
jgi:hypothetical protein